MPATFSALTHPPTHPSGQKKKHCRQVSKTWKPEAKELKLQKDWKTKFWDATYTRERPKTTRWYHWMIQLFRGLVPLLGKICGHTKRYQCNYSIWMNSYFKFKGLSSTKSDQSIHPNYLEKTLKQNAVVVFIKLFNLERKNSTPI